MMDNGLITRSMAMECTHGKMEESMKDSTKTIKNTGRELTHGQMGVNIWENGKTIKGMGRVNI